MLSELLLSQLTKTLTGSLVSASGRRLRRVFADPEREQALERCAEAGIVALVQAAGTDDEAERDHLEGVLEAFLTSEEIAADLGSALAMPAACACPTSSPAWCWRSSWIRRRSPGAGRGVEIP